MPRPPLALFALIPFLSSCARSVPTPADAGYIAPTLSGWDKDEPGANGEQGDATTYRKKVGTTKLRMKFSLLAPRNGENPDDLASLKQHADANLADAQKTSPSLKVLEEKETSFRGFPALLTHTQDKYRNANRERKILRVADGKNTFLIDQTLTGHDIDDAARKEAEDAWNKVSSELQIKPNGS